MQRISRSSQAIRFQYLSRNGISVNETITFNIDWTLGWTPMYKYTIAGTALPDDTKSYFHCALPPNCTANLRRKS